MICEHTEKSGKPPPRPGCFLGLVVKPLALGLEDKGSNSHSANSLRRDGEVIPSLPSRVSLFLKCESPAFCLQVFSSGWH